MVRVEAAPWGPEAPAAVPARGAAWLAGSSAERGWRSAARQRRQSEQDAHSTKPHDLFRPALDTPTHLFLFPSPCDFGISAVLKRGQPGCGELV